MRGLFLQATVATGILILAFPSQSSASVKETGSHVETVHDLQMSRHVRGLTIAGLSLQAVSTAALVGSWIFMHYEYGCAGRELLCKSDVASLLLLLSSGVTYIASTPMIEVAYMKSRKALGLKPLDLLCKASWVVYGITIPSLVLMSILGSAYLWVAAVATAFYGMSLLSNIVVGSKTLTFANKMGRSATSWRPTIVPHVSGIPGGVMAGVGGSF